MELTSVWYSCNFEGLSRVRTYFKSHWAQLGSSNIWETIHLIWNMSTNWLTQHPSAHDTTIIEIHKLISLQKQKRVDSIPSQVFLDALSWSDRNKCWRTSLCWRTSSALVPLHLLLIDYVFQHFCTLSQHMDANLHLKQFRWLLFRKVWAQQGEVMLVSHSTAPSNSKSTSVKYLVVESEDSMCFSKLLVCWLVWFLRGIGAWHFP